MSENHQGWIRLHRKIWDWYYYFKEPFTRTQAWIDLVLLANHQDGIVIIRDNTINVARGQLARGERGLASRWKWSRDKLRHYLAFLEAQGQISVHRNNIVNIYTIINYESYQTTEHTTGHTTGHTTRKPQNIPQENLNNNVKNVNNVKEEVVNGNGFAEKLISCWNQKCPKKLSGVSELLAVEREIAALNSPLPVEELLTAIDNYAEALSFSDTQAYQHTLCQWLRKEHYKNYLPGYYNPENYHNSNFKKGTQGKTREQIGRELDEVMRRVSQK